MGCGCGNKGSGSAVTSYVVVMPSGRQKAFSSKQGAQQEVARTPGAYLKETTPVSS